MDMFVCKKRNYLIIGGFGAASLFLLGELSASEASKERPNIIFLLTDDQRWDDMGCGGNKIIRTPNMDKLAEQGTLFENMFVTASACMTSRASIFVSQYERSHGCNFGRQTLLQSTFEQSYPVLLRKAGYRTGFIGKFGLAVTEAREPAELWTKTLGLAQDQFDVWHGYAGQGKFWPKGREGKHLTTIMGEQAIEFIRSNPANQPFCLSVSFKAPHLPWHPDPAYDELYKDDIFSYPKTAAASYFEAWPTFLKYTRGRKCFSGWFGTQEQYNKTNRLRYRLITGIDTVIGRIRRVLEEVNLQDNTVVILSSDNGWFYGEHGLGAKVLLYEESIRVPLIVCDPRLEASRRGQRRKELVLNLDIAPTILSLAGLQPPRSMQGRDVVPLVCGRKIGWRKDFFCENLMHGQGYPEVVAVRITRWKYIRYVKRSAITSIAQTNTRASWTCPYLPISPPYEQLYDLRSDPLEVKDLSDDKHHE
ncbi:MAG: sulfatase family protein, partial [Planctomycetota bacterium]